MSWYVSFALIVLTTKVANVCSSFDPCNPLLGLITSLEKKGRRAFNKPRGFRR